MKLVAGRLDTNFPEAFDADEAKGITVRVGEWRTAPLGHGVNSAGEANPEPISADYPERWGCLRDGYLFPQFKAYDTRQEAVDFILDRLLSPYQVEREETLYVLRVDDMIGVYDERNGEGAYAMLSDEEKRVVRHRVKNSLESGLGEAWLDYMETSVMIAEDALLDG